MAVGVLRLGHAVRQVRVSTPVGMSWTRRAACGDVEHLRAATDREQRNVARHRPPGEVDLELVAARLGVVHAGVSVLPVERRVDIAAARQQDALDFLSTCAGSR